MMTAGEAALIATPTPSHRNAPGAVDARRPIAALTGFGMVVIAELECNAQDLVGDGLALFDVLSSEIGAIMRERIRDDDLFGLVDNRHFVLILKGGGAPEAMAVMDRIRAAVSADPGFQAFGLGLRYGMAELDMDDQIASLARATEHLREVRRREERLRKVARPQVS